MTTIRGCLDVAIKFLEENHISGARLDAELLMGYTLDRDRPWVLAHDNDILLPHHIADFDSSISRRSKHIPVVHIIGTRDFYGLSLAITPDVLTPRVETEQMVIWAVSAAPINSRLIDIGTGSGAIALAIGVNRPDLHITATEISSVALKVARANTKTHRVNLNLVTSDLWASVTGSFDTIVTNLPYLRDDADLMPEAKREPAIALFGGADGLELYRRFLEGIPAHLSPGGHLFTECDPWQHQSLIGVAAKVGLKPVQQGYFILGFKLGA